jgi:hypothetical protein
MIITIIFTDPVRRENKVMKWGIVRLIPSLNFINNVNEFY